MAVTSIWPIKGRVDRVINYARNPEKTTEASYEELASLHAIDNVVEYAADDMKTERRSYVSCINLRSEQTAAQEDRIEKSRQSEPTSKPKEPAAPGTSDPQECSRPSVKQKLKEITAEQREKAAKGKDQSKPPRGRNTRPHENINPNG